MDPFQKPKPKHAPGAQAVADFLFPSKPKDPLPALTGKETIQLFERAGGLVGDAGRYVAREVDLYAQPTAPGYRPVGQSAAQQKVAEEFLEFVVPSRVVKTIFQLGEAQGPGVGPAAGGHGHGLGIGEEDAIFRMTERQRAERERFYADLNRQMAAASAVRRVVIIFGASVASASIQTENIRPVNAAALANEAAAEGIRAALVQERADP